MFFKGSGKECRLHVQELNASKGINDQNYQSDVDVHQLSGPVDGVLMEPIQNNWSKFIELSDENDSNNFGDVHNTFQDASIKETTQTNQSIQKSGKTNNHSLLNDFVDNKDNASSNLAEEYYDPVNKKRKVDSEMTKESKWSKYLPDEFSDESN